MQQRLSCWQRRTIAVAVICLPGAVNSFSAHGQVVQLPTFHNVSVSTSAWVPDAGTAGLGGANYGSTASNSTGWGPYAPRSASSAMGGSSFSVSAQVIDLQALDEAILAHQPTPSSSNSAPLSIGRNFVAAPGESRAPRVAVQDPGAWQRALAGGGIEQGVEAANAETNIRFYLERAKRAEEANRIYSARVYYRMAMNAMTPQLIARYQAIIARREAESKTQAAVSVAPRQNF